MEKQMEAHLQEESKLWSFVVLCQKQIKNARKIRERKLTWRNSRGEQLQDTFWALLGVHFIHTICCFEAQEVRSPTLQMVCESKLKWRSYGHLKTTAPSWAKILHLRNHLQAHVCHFASSNSVFAAANQVAKSSPSCKIINSTCEIFTSSICTCEIHLCNLKYLRPTQLDFFSRYFV